MTQATDKPTDKSLEEQFKQRLRELGLLMEIKRPLPTHLGRRNRQPIPLEGNPVSELIIKERR